MTAFAPVTAERIIRLLPVFREAGGSICDDTAGVTYQWRNLFNTQLAEADGGVITRSDFQHTGSCYTMPVGNGGHDALFALAEQDAAGRGETLRFACVPEARLRELTERYGNDILIENKRSWADYLYPPENFAYSGKHMHGQRNFVNRFYREHPEARLVPVTEKDAAEVGAFLDRVVAMHPEMNAWEKGEVEGTRDLLGLCGPLGEQAAVLMTDAGIVAFSMGEMQGNTLFVHAEKADTSFAGAYPAMAQAFVRFAGAEAEFINREDDAGDAGIRLSKEQYRPSRLLEKYLVTVR